MKQGLFLSPEIGANARLVVSDSLCSSKNLPENSGPLLWSHVEISISHAEGWAQ